MDQDIELRSAWCWSRDIQVKCRSAHDIIILISRIRLIWSIEFLGRFYAWFWASSMT